MPKNTLLLTAAAAVLAAIAASPAAAQESPDTATVSPAALQDAVVAEMNRVRENRGRTALKTSAVLSSAALGHSAFLSNSGLFQHEDAQGRPFWNRIVEAGYGRNKRMSENLAQVSQCTPATARLVVSLWMGSPLHRVNLLDRKVRFTGVGVTADADCTTVTVTADYGS
jgi:uncharacterized protein YkwD